MATPACAVILQRYRWVAAGRVTLAAHWSSECDAYLRQALGRCENRRALREPLDRAMRADVAWLLALESPREQPHGARASTTTGSGWPLTDRVVPVTHTSAK
jgi:hypothetical protein